jgi:hypothetical protein
MSSSAGQHQPDQARRAKALRWVLMTGLAAMVAIGLVLLFLLTQATNNQALYEENYSRLFVVNMVAVSYTHLRAHETG